MKLQENNFFSFFKVLLLFILYIVNNFAISMIFSKIGINNSILIIFIADLIFLFVSVLLYKKDLMIDFYKLKKSYNIKKLIIISIKYLVLIFCINIIISFIASFFTGDIEEINSIQNLVNESIPYLIFKSLIFSPIAETILFQKSIKSITNSKILYMLSSTLIFALMNIVYMDFSSCFFIFDIIGYFSMALVFSYMYIKNDNIFPIMITKFLYNIIPLIANILMGVIK